MSGSTEIVSAPPAAAAKQATVLRSRFVSASRLVSMRKDVSAWTDVADGSIPQTSCKRVHNRRSALIFAI